MGPKGFAEVLAEDRRLTILRFLADDPGYSLNEFVLRSALSQVAHEVSADRLLADGAWLAEQGLISHERLEEVSIFRLTRRGCDVASGRVIHPGVKRPEPGF